MVKACSSSSNHSPGAVAVPRSYFGAGNGQIFLDNVKCVGTEGSVLQCQHNPVGMHNCYSNEIAGVICGGENMKRHEWNKGLNLIFPSLFTHRHMY